MNPRQTAAFAAVLGVVLFAWACTTENEQTSAPPERPKPLLDLARQSYARRVTELPVLPPGPGAEGRLGDLLMENAFVRFVVAAADHVGPGRLGGNVIDAAVQGGEDRMRLLTPLLGAEAKTQPVYEDVHVETAGGQDTPAIVVSTGHLTGNPAVKVVTTYTLPPDSPSLEIATRVENGTGSMLALFSLGDVLYNGRTLRFVPGTALLPEGRKSLSKWMSFFWQDRVWGIICAPPGAMDAVHDAGSTELRYATVDIPSGESRAYRRFLMAAAGGPDKVWESACPTLEEVRSHLAFEVREQGTGEPVAGAQIIVLPDDKSPTVLLVTDSLGRAELSLAAGRYSVTVAAPGRPVLGPVTVACVAQQSHSLSMSFAPRAEAIVRVKARSGGYVAPTDARISCYRAGEVIMPFPPATAFPMPGESGVELADALSGGRVPLTTFTARLPGSCVLGIAHGPLFESPALSAAAEPGRTVELAPTLEQSVEPGEYVSVDFRQHTDASLDCALTLAERALSDACEGLDGAIVSDPVFRTVLVGLPRQAECCLIPGFRLALEGVGSFSLYPIEARGGHPPDLWAIAKPGRPAAEVLKEIRQRLPGAIIQVDSPLDERSGYFALSGFKPGARPLGLADFDAIEILSGRDVSGAKRLLPYWFSLLNDGRRILATGGSGSRAIAWETAGIARTFVRCRRTGSPMTPGGLAAAVTRLKDAADAFVTNGPFISATLNGKPIGSLQTVRGGKVRMQLRVYGPLWMDVSKVTVYRNGKAVQELLLPEAREPQRCDRVLELEAPADSWFVVVVEGNQPMSPTYEGGPSAPKPFAMTNPFWVDVDGDGAVKGTQ